MGASSSNYLEWNIDNKWSSQEWKSGDMLEARTVRPVSGQPAGSFTQHTDKFVIDDDDMDSDTATHSNLFSKITIIPEQSEWPFSRRFNARQRQTFFDLVNVYVFNIGNICIHGKNYSENLHSVKNRENSHFKADVRHIWKNWNNQMRFVECPKSAGMILNGNNYLWSMMKKSSVSHTRSFTYFQILYYASLERWNGPQHQILLGNSSWIGSKIHHNIELWTHLTENRWNSSGIFSRIHYIAARPRSPKAHEQMGEPEQFQGRSIFMSMLNDIMWRIKDNATECIANSTLMSVFAKRFPARRCSFLGPGSETKRSVFYLQRKTTKKIGSSRWMDDQIRRKRTPSSPSHESIVSRNAQKQRRWKIIYTLLCRWSDTIETVFRTIISVNQLSIYGAVSDLCEECSNCRTRTRRPVLAEQSDPFFAPASLLMKTPTPSDCSSCARRSIAEVPRTSGKAITTESCD